MKNPLPFLISAVALVAVCGCGHGLVVNFGARHGKPSTDTTGSGEMGYNKLTEFESKVLLDKATEMRGTGELLSNKNAGTYICRRCNAPLYTSEHKFESGCGWPSFDDEIEGAVRRERDPDGRRTEILCENCDGHLGHVFIGEQITSKNTRHCVNSASMRFVNQGEEIPELLNGE